MATGRPRFENWANGGSSTLNGGITDSATSLIVTSASSFPVYPDFKILIGSEILTVTAISSNTFTVIRGEDGTTAAAHSDTDAVTHVFTAAGIERAFKDNSGFGYPYNRILAQGVTKTAADFTWNNQGANATCIDADDGGLIMRPGAVENLRQTRGKYLAAPSTPWTCTAFVQMGTGLKRFAAGQGTTVGLFARESSSDKFYVLILRTDVIAMQKQSSSTAYNSDVDSFIDTSEQESVWLRLGDDGTDVTGEVSFNGADWELCFDEPRGTYMTATPGPDQVGFFGENGQGHVGTELYIKSWILE
jgi:hypothetical protein